MNKIDYRKNYYIVLDTETTDIARPLPYDIGWTICDSKGNVYRTRSFVVKEIFFDNALMATAYYAKKIPQYYAEIASGERIVAKFATILERLLEDRELFHCEVITAHNAFFDKRVLENACAEILGEWFVLPTITEIYDTQRMAKDTICKQKKYEKFCKQNNLLTPTGRIPQNAEAIYCYLTNDPNYKEEHTGLADTLIEKDILVKCLSMRKPMPKKVIAVY